MLTQERLKELLDYDPETGVFVRKASRGTAKAGSVAGCMYNTGYIMIRIDSKDYTAHRLAWLYVYGCWPTNQIDHINRVKDDNRLCNLREATQSENNWNVGKYKNNKSGLTGVSWHNSTKKWQAQISVNGKLIYLGLFDTPEEGHAAYLKAKAAHHKFSLV